MPHGATAYARVLHPVDRADGSPHLTWAGVCAITGRIPHPLMQWHSITRGADGPWEDGEPVEGNLAPATGDQDCFHALWDGWGWLHGGAIAVVVAHDGDGPPPTPPRVEPGLLWPADRSWCVATEIDFDSTLVGGDTDLVAAVLAAPGLEAWPVTPADRLTYASDLLNGGPPTPR